MGDSREGLYIPFSLQPKGVNEMSQPGNPGRGTRKRHQQVGVGAMTLPFCLGNKKKNGKGICSTSRATLAAEFICHETSCPVLTTRRLNSKRPVSHRPQHSSLVAPDPLEPLLWPPSDIPLARLGIDRMDVPSPSSPLAP